MRHIDFYFFYKYSIRFVLLNKLGLVVNTFQMPNFSKLICFFSLIKLEDFDDVQVYIICIYLSFFLVVRLF